MRVRSYLALSALSPLCLAFTESAVAQSTEQKQAGQETADADAPGDAGDAEIIVTANRREMSAQRVGIALSAFSGDTLDKFGVIDTSGLASVTPGLQFTPAGGSPVAGLISIRGVSQNDFAGHIEPANAFYVDEVYQPSSATTVRELFDVERVEVLKGPQGTLFGRNATGGLIQIVSAKPSDAPKAYIQATLGSYDWFRAEGAVSGPIAEGIAARFSFLRNRHDGYFRNASGPDINADDTWAARLQVEFEPTEQLSILLSGDYYKMGPVTTGGQFVTAAQPDANGLGIPLPPGTPTGFGYVDADGRPFTVDYNFPGSFEREIWGASARISYDLGGVQLFSLTSYQAVESVYRADNDGSPIDFARFGQDSSPHTITQELRLQGESGDLQYTGGFFFLDIQGENYYQEFIIPPFGTTLSARYRLDTRSYSVFGQGEYRIGEQWSVTAGLRYTYDRKNFDYLNTCTGPACPAFIAPGSIGAAGRIVDRHDENGVSARLQVDWTPSESVLAYASFNRGYKAFNYNAGFSGGAPLEDFRFDGETLNAYEVGLKSSFLDRKVRFNVAGFYYDYSDYQAFDQRGFNFTLFNTQAEIYGLDADLEVRPGLGFVFGAGIALLHTNVEDVPIPSGTVDREAPQSPPVTINLNGSKSFALGSAGDITISANAAWTDTYFAQLTNAPVTLQPANWLVNSRISWTLPGDRIEVAVFANNVLNAERQIYGFDVSGPPLGAAYRNFDRPRFIGVEAKVRY